MSARKTPLERLEELATEIHGRGTAISTDLEGTWWIARVWSAKGVELAAFKTLGTKSSAVEGLRQQLIAREVTP